MYIDNGWIGPARMSVIPNGVVVPDATRIKKLRQQGPRNNHVHFLFLGQLASHKGIPTLLAAISKLPRNIEIVFSFAGKGVLEGLVETTPDCNYVGQVNGIEKTALLESADVLVLPSEWYENNPISVLEALNHGLAIIGANIGGIPELVNDGVNGYVFRAGDVDDLLSKIVILAQDKTLLRQFQESSLGLAPRFGIDIMTENYLALYGNLVDVR
jgi:glycosyltransferase involved in cell wall biosynthesis